MILDASFKKGKDRAAALELAGEMNADFLLIECPCEEETIRERLERRAAKRTNLPTEGGKSFRSRRKTLKKSREWTRGLFLSLNTRFPA